MIINRLELHTESSSTKPELIFMDQIEEVPSEFTQFKNEQCIQIKFKESIRTGNVVLTNPVSFHLILFFIVYFDVGIKEILCNFVYCCNLKLSLISLYIENDITVKVGKWL